MYGDNLENLELITLDLIKDMNEELRSVVETDGCVNMRPILRQCTAGIITSIVGYAKQLFFIISTLISYNVYSDLHRIMCSV